MTMAPLLPGSAAALARLARRFARARSGLAAVEFALLLPIMLMFYVGGSEVITLLTLDRKVGRTASTVTDLLSQEALTLLAGSSSDYNLEVANIMDAAEAVLEPFDTSKAKILLLIVNVDATPQTIVKVSQLNDIVYAIGAASPIAVPSAIATSGDVVVGRVSYSYTSPFSSALTGINGDGSYHLQDTYFLKPRGS